VNKAAEWLETNGLGGFASGTVSGIRSRRYHALLLVARTPPTGRVVLVNGFDAWLRIGGKTWALSSQLYTPEVVEPDGRERLEDFTAEPWPRWTYNLGGVRLDQEVLVPHGTAAVVVSWRLREPAPAAELTVRPFLSGRDYHALQHENTSFRFEPEGRGPSRIFRPYPDVPAVVTFANGTYAHEPYWYRDFVYLRERERGLDSTEDLASPGTWRWDMQRGEAILIFAAEDQELPAGSPAACLGIFRGGEQRRRRALGGPLLRAADAYLARRDGGRTLIAGYPWFTDWGRDTFIALRGLCLACGRLEEAAAILLAWARTLSQGMVPNRFPDAGGEPEYNSVDASLWFVLAVEALLLASGLAPGGPLGSGGGWISGRGVVANGFPSGLAGAPAARVPGGPAAAGLPGAPAAALPGGLATGLPGGGNGFGAPERQALLDAVEAIVAAYAAGTRHGIHADDDGLLAAGEPGSQLTWMDARVDGLPVTPRCGKAVEVQALWIHALAFAARCARAAVPAPPAVPSSRAVPAATSATSPPGGAAPPVPGGAAVSPPRRSVATATARSAPPAALAPAASRSAAPGPAAAARASRWHALHELARASFQARFWNEAAGCLYDVVDVDHRRGAVDATVRPNQVLAVGGLPTVLLPEERARRVVDLVEARLWTPLGLRSLAPGEPGYRPRYEGDPRSRDGAYHQGTAWPWLLGPFIEAWVRVRGGGEEAKREARERFLAPLTAGLDVYGLGHLPEIADGDPPHKPRGCPFQAWSLGELLRLSLEVLR
jgi:glycogen debranching enzyme